MSCKVLLPDDKDPVLALADMRKLGEEDPQLFISWDEELREIYIRPMGTVQLEVLSRMMRDRFGYEVAFGQGSIAYKETIAAPVEGVGHFCSQPSAAPDGRHGMLPV